MVCEYQAASESSIPLTTLLSAHPGVQASYNGSMSSYCCTRSFTEAEHLCGPEHLRARAEIFRAEHLR